MKKKLLCISVAMVMMLSSFASGFAALVLDPINLDAIRSESASVVYEGNKPLITAEKILDGLNADAGATIFDQAKHQAQLTPIETACGATQALTAGNVDASVTHITATLTDYQKQYLMALVMAEGNSALADALANPIYDTSAKTLRESFGTLGAYRTYMAGVFTAFSINANDYAAYADDAKQYVAEPIIAFLKILFSELGTEVGGMRDTYVTEFLTDDRAKKTFAVLFGEALTHEVVSDSVDSHKGIVRHVKNYLSANPGVIADVKTAMETVLDPDAVQISAACDILGGLAYAAYDSCATCSDSIRDDVAMLLGDGNDTGLFEQMLIDINQPLACNAWINLFLSEYVQMTLASGDLNTISAATPNPSRKTIADGTSASFEFENLEDYGIGGSNVALPNDYFDVVCYYEDGTENTNVAYNSAEGKMVVTRDDAKPATYEGFITVYRKDAAGSLDTFIESYPVEIRNYIPSGGGGVSRYTISYETNGGTQLSSESHAKGKVVELTKAPTKEGYIFAGWYLDKELTQKVTSIVMDKSVKLYAAWTKDGSAVVSNVPVPEILNGDDHYAYIMGYPDGTILPQGNITRAETATIIFRLLKDEIRDKNITNENAFADVNEEDWFNTAISTLAALGIVQGRTETEFMPNEKITRAEFSVIMARIADFSHEASHEFKDVSSHWAEDYIYEAAAYGWIAGYEDATFRPDQFITRAEAMTLTNRVLRRVPENKDALLDGMTEWSDNKNTNAWYYIAVQEATNSHKYERKNETFEIWTELMEAKDWTQYE